MILNITLYRCTNSDETDERFWWQQRERHQQTVLQCLQFLFDQRNIDDEQKCARNLWFAWATQRRGECDRKATQNKKQRRYFESVYSIVEHCGNSSAGTLVVLIAL